MEKITSNIQCPSCQGALQPVVLVCGACGVKVEGPFQFNEFASLSAENLHFLRIFVQCEGRIRDMESSLGLSYPTIRTRISALKNKLFAPVVEDKKAPETVQGILESLSRGEIGFDETMAKIKTIQMKE